jgi:PAS domain S-box-containing protein
MTPATSVPLEVCFRYRIGEAPGVASVSGNPLGLLGHDAQAFLAGMVDLGALVHVEDRERFKGFFEVGTEAGQRSDNLRVRQANGRIRCVWVTYWRDSSQGLSLLNLTLQDAASLPRTLADAAIDPMLRAMLDNTDDFIFFKDRHHVFTGASQTLVSVTHPSEHWTDLIGKTDYDVFPEEYADVYYRLEQQVFAGIPVAQAIQEYETKDGRKGWVDNRKFPIRDDSGAIVGLFGVARVVTDRVLAERALRLERDSTRNILATVEAMIVALDTEGRITLINRKGCEILGYREEELIGQDWFTTCLPPSIDVDQVRGVFKQALAGNLAGSEYHENPVRTRSGEERLIAWHNSTIRDKDGHIIGGLSAGEDITQRKHNERELQQREQYQRALLDNFPFAVWLKDTESRFLTVNQGFVELFGQRNANDLIGKNDFDIAPADLAEGYRADDRAVLSSGKKKKRRGGDHRCGWKTQVVRDLQGAGLRCNGQRGG